MKPFAFGAPFALGALLMGQRLLGSARPRRDAAWAGALAGLAAAASLPYAVVLLGPLIGIGLRRGPAPARRLAWALLAAGAAAVTLLVLEPYWLLAPARTLAAWRAVTRWYPVDYHPVALTAFFWGSLARGVGPLLMASGLGEGLWQMWSRREALPVLAPSFALMILMAVRTSGLPGDALHARIVLPAALLLCALGVAGLFRAARALPRGVRLLPALAVLPTLLVGAWLLRDFAAAAGQRSTRDRAGAWLNTLPEGSTLGVLAPLAPFRSPYFRLDRFQVVIEPHPDRADGGESPQFFLVAQRSDLPASPAFLARYAQVRRFARPDLPLGLSTFAVYPFADPPIAVYAHRSSQGWRP